MTEGVVSIGRLGCNKAIKRRYPISLGLSTAIALLIASQTDQLPQGQRRRSSGTPRRV